MNLRILFVDDEPNVLEGLRRMLRPLRHEWSAEFAAGGRQALALLERTSFDVVVSDMRMPGLSGAELLEEVSRRHPRAVRIVLSGQCDEGSALRAVRVAHRMLSKPCDAETLKATVTRACALRDLLASEALLELVARQGSVPSLPALYAEVIRELELGDPSLDKVVGLIAQDVGMSAKLLHLANSAFFGAGAPVSSPRQAVIRLGLQTMRTLVLAAGIFSRFRVTDPGPLSLDALWAHSQATSALARAIARAEGADAGAADLAAVAGLLHDVGKLVLLHSLPGAYRDVLTGARRTGTPTWEAEREAFGASHAEVGACLLGLWGLPPTIVEAVAWHHRPGDFLTPSFGPVTAVHAADALLAEGRPQVPPALDLAYLRRLNLLERLPRWRELCAG